MKRVILSTTIILEVGKYEMLEIGLEGAKEFAKSAENFVGHTTVKILGIEPAKDRKNCDSYDEALILKPLKRLEFGKEYTLKELEQIGFTYFLISRHECIGQPWAP